MKILRDSSEIQEALSLLDGLSKSGSVLRTAKAPAAKKSPRRPRRNPKATAPAAAEDAAASETDLGSVEQLPFRDDRIQHLLGAMCRRAGFTGAVLADREGLPLAAYHSPASIEAASACSSVLGEAMARAASLLEQSHVNHISMTVSETEKICLHTFAVNGLPCHLLILAAQEIDEREEMLQCVRQLTQLISDLPPEPQTRVSVAATGHADESTQPNKQNESA